MLVSVIGRSFLSEVERPSILRTGLPVAPSLSYRPATHLSAHAPAQRAGAQRLRALKRLKPSPCPVRGNDRFLRGTAAHDGKRSLRIATLGVAWGICQFELRRNAGATALIKTTTAFAVTCSVLRFSPELLFSGRAS